MVSTFAYEVRGEEMNQAAGQPILPGAIATCLSFDELNKPIAEGEIYVFTRAFDGGSTVETRMGRAHVFNDRTELVPESSNRSLRPVTYPSKDGADGVVTILGLVYGIHYPVGRFA